MASCKHCKKDLSSFSDHGVAIHRGKCRERRERAYAAQAAVPRAEAAAALAAAPVQLAMVVEPAMAVEMMQDHVDDVALDPHGPPIHPIRKDVFETPADEALAEMFAKYPALTMAQLNAIIAINKLGPITFSSAKALMKKVDKLPGALFGCIPMLFASHTQVPACVGIEFDVSIVRVREVEYDLYHRNLRGVLEGLLDQVGGELVLPQVHRGATDGWSELWHGDEYQRFLRQFLESGADLSRDVLMPLIFFSGMFLLSWSAELLTTVNLSSSWPLSLRSLADETNLVSFNTTSDQATTYPLLVSIGLTPGQLRMKPKATEVLAVFPKFLARKHPGASDPLLADLRRELVWRCMEVALQDLCVGSACVQDTGFAYVAGICMFIRRRTCLVVMRGCFAAFVMRHLPCVSP